MRDLRSHVDAVMVGAGTLRAEKLSLGLDDPGAVQPLAVVVSGSGDVPIKERLVGHHRGVILAVPEGRPRASGTGDVDLTVLEVPASADGRVNPGRLLQLLRAEHAVERLLVEGGPTLNRALIEEGLVDELFLTLAPKLLGGAGGAKILGSDPLSGRPSLSLLSVYLVGHELFLRYALH